MCCVKRNLVMGPSYLHRMVWEYGEDLADKSYLFADPFSRPLAEEGRPSCHAGGRQHAGGAE